MADRALITGITGQDGSYLAELLLAKGYEVHGVRRRASSDNLSRIRPLLDAQAQYGDRFRLHYGDVTDSSNMVHLFQQVNPTEVYNLAAQSQVRVSFDTPEYTANVDAMGPLRILEAVRVLGLEQSVKVYQASTSEIFGNTTEIPQRETTVFNPRSPYGAAKAFALYTVRNYRDGYGMFAVNGILFNHESPRRDPSFVSRKITTAIARMKLGQQDSLVLGNLDAKRDWGFAPEYVEAMWRMLQEKDADDYVIATGETHTVRDFVNAAFKVADYDLEWEGAGVEEIARERKTGKILVSIDPWFMRPTEVDVLQGDASKAKAKIGWAAQTKFEDLVSVMVKADIAAQSVHS